MLAKTLLACTALLTSSVLNTVSAKMTYETKGPEMIYRRDTDWKYNPTNYLFFDPNDDPIQPKKECTVEVAETRRCGLDRHSLWTCKKSEDGMTASWVVDTNTGPDGNNCEKACCRPNEIAANRLEKCTRGRERVGPKDGEGRDFCWQILKPNMLIESDK